MNCPEVAPGKGRSCSSDLPGSPSCRRPLPSFVSNFVSCSAAPSQFIIWFKLIKFISVVCNRRTLIGINPFIEDSGTDRQTRVKSS